jgi:hypothetical protein
MTYLLLATGSRPNGNNKEYAMKTIVSTVIQAIDRNANRSFEAVFLFSLLGLTLTLAFTRLAVI